MVKVFAPRAEDLGFVSHLHHGNFSESSDTSDLKTGTPVATLPGTTGSALGLVHPNQYTVTGVS